MRNGRYAALAGSAISSVLLVADLGRPERFLKMLRIAKLKSPMSVGVYTLVTFSTGAGLAALEQAAGRRSGAVSGRAAGGARPARARR